MQTGYASGGEGDSSGTGYAALNYRGGYGNANVGYSRSDGFKQLYYGVSGGVLAHANGVTLSQPLNDTVVLVKAPGAGDVKVEKPDRGAYRLARLCGAALRHRISRKPGGAGYQYPCR